MNKIFFSIILLSISLISCTQQEDQIKGDTQDTDASVEVGETSAGGDVPSSNEETSSSSISSPVEDF